MDRSNALNILKNAFLMERQGKSLYETDGAADTPPAILSQDLKDKINAAGFEATAITAAIGFEQKAVKLYGDRAETTTDPEEKKLYQRLSAWEQTHLKKLLTLQEDLKQLIW
jgi:hypothetical protein